MTTEPESLEKWIPSLATRDELYSALSKAFEYRGDITIVLKDGSKIVGYVFNREAAAPEPFIELYPADRDEKTKIQYKDIAALNFSGVDTASGKSWAAWIAKYNANESITNNGLNKEQGR